MLAKLNWVPVKELKLSCRNMSYSLNSLGGNYIGDYGTTIRVSKGDTRSLDYGSYGYMVKNRVPALYPPGN